jgi:multidrug efflux pump subunit AcrA (membrane-fusion protein)
MQRNRPLDRSALRWALAATLALGACRAEKSAKPPAASERAPDPTAVTLSPEAIRAGGIEVATAEANRSPRVLTLTGALSATPWTAEEQTALSEAENADAKLRLAEASFARVSQLSAGGFVSRQDLDVARSALEQARSTAEQTDAKRRNLGLAEAAGSTAWLPRVWGLAALPESELPKVAAGQAVEVKTSAFPGRVFRGKVSGISGSAGENTRQFTVRIAVEDPGGRLRPQMLATFEISGAAGAGLAIPSSAVLIQADGSYVYVASGNTFLRRAVRTGASGGGQVEVTQGLSVGERVVVDGAQLLESERLKSEIKTGD